MKSPIPEAQRAEGRISRALANENLKRFILTMAGSNILTRKQLEKMPNNQLIDFAMKVQENLISKQNALSNETKKSMEIIKHRQENR